MNITATKTSLSVTYSMNIIEINPLIFVSHSKTGIDIQHEYHSNKSTMSVSYSMRIIAKNPSISVASI